MTDSLFQRDGRETEHQAIRRLLSAPCTIAVVGLSPKTHRASHEVSAYMQAQGFRIVPVNPNHAGRNILGERCVASLGDAAEAARQDGEAIRIVNCFRASEAIPPIVDDAVAIGAEALWMQLGVVHEAAAARARAAGLTVVMDRCIKIDHALLRR